MISTRREAELLFYWESETQESWTQEWREELTNEERELVESWDAKWNYGLYQCLRGLKTHGAEE